MNNFFSTSNNQSPQSKVSSKGNELIQRWNRFLWQIETRYNESLAHAEKACIEQMQDTKYDYDTVFRTWQGIKAQIFKLIEKIDEVWQEKVEEEMRAEGDFWIHESFKGHALNDKLYSDLERFQMILEGKLSKIFYNHAIIIAEQNFVCSQCNAPLEVQKKIFRSQYVSCHYCNAVNTFEPETKFTEIAGSVVNNIAALNCLKEYDRWREAQKLFEQERTENKKDSITKFRKAYFEYYEKYFQERILLQPDLKLRLEEDKRRKKQEFETLIDSNK